MNPTDDSCGFVLCASEAKQVTSQTLKWQSSHLTAIVPRVSTGAIFRRRLTWQVLCHRVTTFALGYLWHQLVKHTFARMVLKIDFLGEKKVCSFRGSTWYLNQASKRSHQTSLWCHLWEQPEAVLLHFKCPGRHLHIPPTTRSVCDTTSVGIAIQAGDPPWKILDGDNQRPFKLPLKSEIRQWPSFSLSLR